MNKLKSKLYRFMYGRYGTDTLSRVNLWAYAVVLIIYTVLRIAFAFALKGNTLAPTILSICYVVISAILVFRCYMNICLEGDEDMEQKKTPFKSPVEFYEKDRFKRQNTPSKNIHHKKKK